MRRGCPRCGTPYPMDGDAPHLVLCAGCGARRRHPRAALRPVALRLEAMHYYSSRRQALLSHTVWAEALALAIVLGAAAGGFYLAGIVELTPPGPAELLTRLSERLGG